MLPVISNEEKRRRKHGFEREIIIYTQENIHQDYKQLNLIISETVTYIKLLLVYFATPNIFSMVIPAPKGTWVTGW